jgi:pilus assembly protein TadC
LPLRLTPLLVGLAGWLFVGGWIGLVVGALVGLGAWVALRRLPSPGVARERREAVDELPYGVDLLAAALRAGAPVDRALTVVGAALGGPLGRRFDEVGRALRLGVHGVRGWDALSDVPEARGLVAAAVRAAESGAALAAACSRSAGELREQRAAAADAAAQRAGIWIVLPLGACFLPAFVLVGVVPILLGVLHDVLA